MIVEGIVEPMELAHLPYRKGTYEDYVGRLGLERDCKKKWRRHVADVVERLVDALQPDKTVIGGGNVHKLKSLPMRCRQGDNANAFLCGFRLWVDDKGVPSNLPPHPRQRRATERRGSKSPCGMSMNAPGTTANVVTPGESAPLGATVRPGGVNFSVYSKRATLIELLLFDDENARQPSRIIPLHADKHRTYHYWHVFVPALRPGQVYAYRVHGPYELADGLRFDGEKVLLDPYGFAVTVPEAYDRGAAARPGDNCATAMKSVVADRTATTGRAIDRSGGPWSRP